MSKKELEFFCRHPVYICYLAAWNGKCYNHGNLCVYNLFSLLNFGLEIGTIKVSGWWIVDLIKVGEKCAFLMPDLHLVHTCCWSPDCTLLLGSSNPAKNNLFFVLLVLSCLCVRGRLRTVLLAVWLALIPVSGGSLHTLLCQLLLDSGRSFCSPFLCQSWVGVQLGVLHCERLVLNTIFVKMSARSSSHIQHTIH